MSVKALALSLPAQGYHTISWRKRTNEVLSGRFVAVGVRHAEGNSGITRPRRLEWLLIERPLAQAGPLKYVLSTLPEDTTLNDLVNAAHHR